MATTQKEPDFAYDVVANRYGFYCMPMDYRHREICQTIAKGGIYEPETLEL